MWLSIFTHEFVQVYPRAHLERQVHVVNGRAGIYYEGSVFRQLTVLHFPLHDLPLHAIPSFTELDVRVFRVMLGLARDPFTLTQISVLIQPEAFDDAMRGKLDPPLTASAWEDVRQLFALVAPKLRVRPSLLAPSQELLLDAPPLQLPPSWRVPLMMSQAQSVAWMHSLEARIESSTNVVGGLPYVLIPHTQCAWVMACQAVLPLEHMDRVQQCVPCGGVKYWGGILADATGSGKTATMLAFIASALHAPPPSFSILAKRGLKFDATLHLIPTRASLVIVPLNLSRQWLDEIAKFCPSLRVKRVVDKRDYTALTYADMMQCDMVLTTLNFLTGRAYVTQTREVKLPVLAHRAACIASGSPVHAPVVFSNFLWQRMVVDEQHEWQGSHSTNIAAMHARVYWGMTGTPDTRLSTNNNTIWRLASSELRSAIEAHALLINATMHRTPFVPSLPPLSVREHVVDLPARERSIVQTHSGITQRIQLATTFSVLPLLMRHHAGATAEEDESLVSMTFAQLSRLMVTQRAEERSAEETHVSALETTVAGDRALLTTIAAHEGVADVEVDNEESGTTLMRTIKRRIKHNERLLSSARERLDAATRQHEFFRTQLEDPSLRQCPICYDADGDVVTQCGHWFCVNCIKSYLSTRRRAPCPVCKKQLKGGEWMQVTQTPPPVAAPEAPAPECSAKLAAIVALLRECKERGEKAVLFVQWAELMRAVRAVLAKHGVHAVAICGNTATRNAALHHLQSGDADVLLLSLETSTSGLNLVQANHVIFAHALVAEYEGTPKRDLVRQAVARVYRLGQTKPVTVHWCIARDTDEHVLYRADVDAGATTV